MIITATVKNKENSYDTFDMNMVGKLKLTPVEITFAIGEDEHIVEFEFKFASDILKMIARSNGRSKETVIDMVTFTNNLSLNVYNENLPFEDIKMIKELKSQLIEEVSDSIIKEGNLLLNQDTTAKVLIIKESTIVGCFESFIMNRQGAQAPIEMHLKAGRTIAPLVNIETLDKVIIYKNDMAFAIDEVAVSGSVLIFDKGAAKKVEICGNVDKFNKLSSGFKFMSDCCDEEEWESIIFNIISNEEEEDIEIDDFDDLF